MSGIKPEKDMYKAYCKHYIISQSPICVHFYAMENSPTFGHRVQSTVWYPLSPRSTKYLPYYKDENAATELS